MSKTAMPSVGVWVAGAVFAAVWTAHLTLGFQLVVGPLGLWAFSLFSLAPRTVAAVCFVALWSIACLGRRRWVPFGARVWWIVTVGGFGVLLVASRFPVAETTGFSPGGIGIIGGPDGPTSIFVSNSYAPRAGFSGMWCGIYLALLLAVFGWAGWAETMASHGLPAAAPRSFVRRLAVWTRRASGWAAPILLGLVSAVCCAVMALVGKVQNGAAEVLSSDVYQTSREPSVIPSRPCRPTETNRVFDGIPADQLLWFASEWSFVGFMDPDAPASSAGSANGGTGRRWTAATLLSRAQTIMNREEGFFWGSAEAQLSYLLNPTDFEALKGKARAVYSGFLSSTKGRICLMNDQSMAFEAQFPGEYQIPVAEDVVWRVPPGRYSIEVLQLFRYDGSAQCPGDCDPDFDPEAVHYAIRISPAGARAAGASYSQIPNQPGYYRLAQ